MCDLKVDGDAVQFFLPVAVAPRYTPFFSPDLLGGMRAGHSGLAGREGLSVALRMRMGSAITGVTSVTHGLQFGAAGGDGRAGMVALAGQHTHLDKDLVILVAIAAPHAPRLAVERGPHGVVAMLTLVPSIALGTTPRCELVFVVDRSGSMGGSKMDHCRAAMQVS